jgi:2-methylisocitrate lyase-like PEP mutase family enzyme
MPNAKALRSLIEAPEILVTPGVYDAFSAFRAQEAGFKAIFLSGSALAAMHLARPDIGLLTLSEITDASARIADRVSIPLFVDADQGFGNAYMAARTMRMLERSGASGIQIEDQLDTKPTSDPLGRPLVPTCDMVDKIKAMLDARLDEAVVVSARSDAVSTEGVDAALERAAAYADAGADMIFVENLKTRKDMERLVAAIGTRKPLLHNLLRAGEEVQDALVLEAMGYSVALFPGVAVQAVGGALDDAFASLAANPKIANEGMQPDRIGGADYLASIRSPRAPR